jgi:two-component system, NarL family, sensor kinase
MNMRCLIHFLFFTVLSFPLWGNNDYVVKIPQTISFINSDSLEKDLTSGKYSFYIENNQPIDHWISIINLQPDFSEKVSIVSDSMTLELISYRQYMHHLTDLMVPPNSKVKIKVESKKKITTPLYITKTDYYQTATSYTNFVIWMVLGGYLFYIIIIGSFAIFSTNRLFVYFLLFEIVTFVLLLFQFNIFNDLKRDVSRILLAKSAFFFIYWIIQLFLIDKLINFSSLYPVIKKYIVYPVWIVLFSALLYLFFINNDIIPNSLIFYFWIVYGWFVVVFLLYIYFKTRRKENLYLIVGFLMHLIIVSFIFDSSVERVLHIPLHIHYFESLFIPFSKWSLILLTISILTLSFLIFISFSYVIKTFSYTQSEVNKLYFKSINAIIDGEEQERRKLKSYFESNFIHTINQQQKSIESFLSNNEDSMSQSIIKDLAYLQNAVKGITDKTTMLKSEMTISDLINVLIKMFGDKIIVTVKIDKSLENTLVKGDYLVHLFRIIQEVFQNILKHAEATEVYVNVHKARKVILIEIADDGKGYELHAAIKSSGIGLKNIAYRVEILKGKYKIEKLNKGTKFELSIPV